MRQNLFWAFAYNTIGIPIAAGLLYPVTGWLRSPVLERRDVPRPERDLHARPRAPL